MHFYLDGYKNIPNRFNLGETTRSYKQRHSDGDYGKAKQILTVFNSEFVNHGYWEDQSTRRDKDLDIGHQDHVIHAWLKKELPGMTQIGRETFEFDESIYSMDMVVQMVEERWFSGAVKKWEVFEPRTYQQRFLNKISKAWQSDYTDFLLFAKPRSGKSAMMLKHIDNWDTKLSVVCSRQKSPEQSWKKDSDKFFPNVRYISVKNKSWKKELEYWMERPVNIVLWGTVQALIKRDIPKPDLLIFDEAHIGGTAKEFVDLKEKLDTRTVYVSGTAHKLAWMFNEDQKFIYTYFDEQLDVMRGVFERPGMNIAMTDYQSAEYKKIFGDDPDAMGNIFLMKDKKFLYPKLVKEFAFNTFGPQRNLRIGDRLLEGSYMMMCLPSVAACHEFKKEVECYYPSLVVTSDTGRDAADIKKFMDDNNKALIITQSANVLGFTNEKIDTILNCKGGESIEFWTQFAFRGGSGDHDWWVIDFAGKRCLKAVYTAYQVACDSNPELSEYEVTDFTNIFEWQDGFSEINQQAFESALSADIETSISSMGSIVHSMDLSDVEFDFSASIFSSHSAVSKVIKDVVIGDSGGNNDSAQTREDVLVKK